MDKDKDNEFWMRRLQTIPINKTAMISLASPIVKKLKLSTHDLIVEQLDGDRIILRKANLPNRQSEDGVV